MCMYMMWNEENEDCIKEKLARVFFPAWTKEIKKQQTWAFGKPGDRTNNEIFHQPEGYTMLHRNISPNHQMWWYHPSTEVRSVEIFGPGIGIDRLTSPQMWHQWKHRVAENGGYR
jgi:hypothetical protein